jgi:acetyl esterase/lipase
MLAGIPYVAASADPNQTLDLHIPVRPAGPDSFPGTIDETSRWPVLVFVHGGVWALGVRDEFANVGEALAARGILTAVLSYRLAPAAKHPAQIEDVASAVAWLTTHAAEYRGDAQRIVLMGQSAGAHLVTLLALEPRWLAAHRLGRERVGGVIAISGIYDLEEPFGDPGQDTGKDYVERVFGPRGPVWREASPVRHLAPPRPDLPLLLVMAEHDYSGIRDQTLKMEAAMGKAGWNPRPVVDVADREHDELVSRIGTAGDPATATIAGFVFQPR